MKKNEAFFGQNKIWNKCTLHIFSYRAINKKVLNVYAMVAICVERDTTSKKWTITQCQPINQRQKWQVFFAAVVVFLLFLSETIQSTSTGFYLFECTFFNKMKSENEQKKSRKNYRHSVGFLFFFVQNFLELWRFFARAAYKIT